MFVVWPNLALKRPASSSSVYSTDELSSSSKAGDGTIDPNYYDGGCFRSANEDMNPWFSVDLGSFYYVQYVILTNRGIGGECCFSWMIAT